ncbi:unnamed protein product [Ceutorhynchus assimilis]|uniref:MI domain-containing protein n=1 Tax=Ceutorhynchus assimilis TaxID=467358 RepID=A0A9N9MJR3_9CUCU|nr:unnamed protein product [Ceutorhynchus assimilis]
MSPKTKKKPKSNKKLSRKELRKEKRKEIKVKRNEYYNKRGKHGGELEALAEQIEKGPKKKDLKPKVKKPKEEKPQQALKNNQVLSTEELYKKEKREQKKIQKDMSKQRKGQLLAANEKEDQNIKKLEKLLNLNKRKTKGVPKGFTSDGLDYLLEVCDPEYMKNAASAEQDLNDGNDNFEEDFALMTNTHNKPNQDNDNASEDDSSLDDDSNNSSDNEEDPFEDDNNDDSSDNEEDFPEDDNNDDSSDNEDEFDSNSESDTIETKRKNSESSDNEAPIKKHKTEANQSNTWEDIYGRLRTKNGEIINSAQNKYIPPAIRAKMEANTSSEDKKRKEQLERLKRQLKGLLNRLAESNMHGIASQIEDLYMKNSRNDMNETLTGLITDSLITPVLSPERLLMEHVVLVSILHANVGTEVGAHFLQTIIKKFDTLSKLTQEDKSLDNVVNILAQLYNFKMFDAKLLYEILNKLASKFDEKNVECILHILRSVGFGLRKDDPLALKNLILELQKQAASASQGKVSNSRVKFLLDVLLAIKNNNVTKIPNYDTTYSEHLKKIMKGFIRKGNYVTALNISLEDLLKADERGKWWVVGSAWTGNITTKTEKSTKSDEFSEKLLQLARKQHMNTDTRRNIFCILMSAEDYLDAFEKLLRLGLKNQQEREIIHVLLHCCLQEKTFNPYYAILAQKFCEYDRKFQMTIKYSVWDKLKALNSHSGLQLSNLAKLLIHLFIEKGLPISTLKIVEFGQLDKITLRLMRQILLGILLHSDLEAVQGVFEKVAHSDKMKMFRESLRLFIHHFLLRNLKSESVPQEQKQNMEERAKMVEKILTAKDTRLRL